MVDQAHRASIESLADLLQTMGGLLLKYGSPTHRLEACLRRTAREHHYRAQVFAVPTGLWMSVTPMEGGQNITRVIRVHDRVIDLERLAGLDRIFNQVAEGQITCRQAILQLVALDRAPSRYPPWMVSVSGGIASGATALFFGGRETEILLGTIAGAIVMLCGMTVGIHRRTRLLVDFVTGLLAGAITWLGAYIDPNISRRALTIATLIIAVPGLTLTAALEEVAERSFVSGAARMLNAGMVLVSLIAGVAVMSSLETFILGAPLPGGPVNPTSWTLLAIATLVTGLGFVACFAIPLRDVPYTLVSGIIAWSVAYIAERFFQGGTLSAGIGAFAVGLYANLMARIFNRPAQVYLVPGIVMLVPGVFGFTSSAKLLSGDVTGGTEGLFGTLMIAGALTIGTLLANAALPPHKAL